MTDLTPCAAENLATLYHCEPLDWARAESELSATPSPDIPCFLGTCRLDGTPHAAGIGPQWSEGALYFTSSPVTRKYRDLVENPKCTISVRLDGIDVVLDGEAGRVSDAPTLERVAAGFRAGGWPAQADGDALTAPYSAPSAGPAPWHVFRFTVHSAVGVATREPYGATRWDFAH